MSLSDVLGRKWSLVIVHELLRDGPLGFSDLLTEINDISSKVLSESLDNLEEAGFVERTIVSERPFRVEYSLTNRGIALDSVIDKVREGAINVT
ncbi:helix-turn-helix transcriptional regulator [Halomicroarcula sp. F13]|uniref:Helix-turn-helix transcriptional regulator n=1 Tax=Haloarcula rubra TaxID=2487747 RepID=A0AAW4PZ46_9EURY|nr:helix-turn-helix transcriptional regulator [Halomicroarcula rubra]